MVQLSVLRIFMKVNFKETIKRKTNEELEIISKDYVFYSEEERLIALNELESRGSLPEEISKIKQSLELSIKMEEENEELIRKQKEAAKYKSSNPALSIDTFAKVAQTGENVSEYMTIEGTVKKIGILTIFVLIGFLFTWNLFNSLQDFDLIQPYVIGGAISAFIFAIIIIFRKKTAPYLAPTYCILQGVALGGLSAFMESVFQGIVVQAVILTVGILFSLLLIYKFSIIQATENFKLIIASATAGIAIYYLIALLGNFIGFQLPYIHENTTVGIIFSLFVVIIAALNLVIDFDFIEKGEECKAPKYMEWYGAFGLMVTVIWLYLEILRLLGKMKKR